jgi:hypothetical protein
VPGWSFAQVAQLVEHATENRSVGGSIPPLGTILIFVQPLRQLCVRWFEFAQNLLTCTAAVPICLNAAARSTLMETQTRSSRLI